ncbi:ESCRT-III subunit protein did4 [Tilletia horrida]|nr:ESCRT-III subunit protein did4 [Tilletia horrida]
MASIIESLFGRAKTPAERLRQHQRSLQKAVRELDRERSKLEQQDKKLIMDIKKAARDGQMSACKVMARDLVRTRRHVQKFVQMRTQLQAVSLRIQTLRSNQQMAEAMRGATRAMGMMNRSMNLPAIQRIMRDFERETATMDMKEEMMGDAVDEAMDDEADGVGEEEEGDAILSQVLDEIGVSLGQQLTDAPTGIAAPSALANPTQRVAIGEGIGASSSGPAGPSSSTGGPSAGAGAGSGGVAGGGGGGGGGGGILGGGGGGGGSGDDALQARLDSLRRD